MFFFVSRFFRHKDRPEIKPYTTRITSQYLHKYVHKNRVSIHTDKQTALIIYIIYIVEEINGIGVQRTVSSPSDTRAVDDDLSVVGLLELQVSGVKIAVQVQNERVRVVVQTCETQSKLVSKTRGIIII